MENNQFLDVIFMKKLLGEKYCDYEFDKKYAYDLETQNVLMKIYFLLVKSQGAITDKEFQEEFNKIYKEDFAKLSKDKQDYVRNDINTFMQNKALKEKENNLKRERKE